MGRNVAKYFFILALLLPIFSLFSQKKEYISGQLIDAKTTEPVVFASIRIKDRALGVISNADGGFRIPLKYKTYGDTLEISALGYETKELLIKKLSVNKRYILELNQAPLQLTEAVVTAKKRKKLTARQIVRRAIKAIPNNYPIEPFSMVGYYRDYQLDSLLAYVNLNEAILKVYDAGFDTTDSISTKVQIYQYAENNDFRRDTTAQKSYNYDSKDSLKVIDQAFLSSYGGNEFTILRVHDAIRNSEINSYSFIHRMKSDLLAKHKFKKEADTNLGDEMLYTISFSKFLLNYAAYGKLYISKDDYAIYKLEYAMYDRNKKLEQGLLNRHGTDNKMIFEIFTEYQKQSDKLYLNYISFHNTFRLWHRPKLVADVVPDFGLNCFAIFFSDKVILNDAISLKNYEVKFKGRNIKMKKVELSDSQDIVFLYPDMYPNKSEQMLREIEIAARFDKITKELFEFKMSNIKDYEGNVINQWTSDDYNQFREFFSQKIVEVDSATTGSLFMKKDRPIFKDQPIVKPDNFDDYWMNTPLQTIITKKPPQN